MTLPANRIRRTLLLNSDGPAITRAAGFLRRGGLVAFPTETVYGLGAMATDQKAIERIFAAKGRPADNPLIVHICCVEQLNKVASAVPARARLLAASFWPGPLSLILKRSDYIAPAASAGLDTVAVRMPAHPTALELIRLAAVPIAAPSANLSGRPSPTSYRHVLRDLTGRVEAIIVDKGCAIGVESTVLDLTGPQAVILRPGGTSKEALEKVLGEPVGLSGARGFKDAPRSPGMKYRHYAPRAPLILVTGRPDKSRFVAAKLACYYRRKGLVPFRIAPSRHTGPGERPREFAARLFSSLRMADARKADLIIAQGTSETGLGLAVMNRLHKAAARVLKVT